MTVTDWFLIALCVPCGLFVLIAVISVVRAEMDCRKVDRARRSEQAKCPHKETTLRQLEYNGLSVITCRRCGKTWMKE